jgi:hypothetical protein
MPPPSIPPVLRSTAGITTLACGVSALAYLLLVRLLRYQARDAKPRKLGYTSHDSLKKMTVEDGWNIQRTILATEFPWIGEKALQFALFRYVTAGMTSAEK